MSRKTTLASEDSQQHNFHLRSLERKFTTLPVEMIRWYYCSSWWLQILYSVVVTQKINFWLKLICLHSDRLNKFYCFFLLENVESES